MQSANFGFLAAHDVRLVTLGGLAERYSRQARCLTCGLLRSDREPGRHE